VPILILAVLIWSSEPNVILLSLLVEKLVTVLPASNTTSVKVNLVLSYCNITSIPAKSALVNVVVNITFPLVNVDDKLYFTFSNSVDV